MNNRAGRTVKNLSGEKAYYSFCPSPLPPVPGIEIDGEMQELLIDAHKKLAVLDSLSSRIPDVDLFISMYVRKEALVSSQIEGTQCTLDDVLNPEIDENANADVSDVVNYVRAINYAVKRLEELPLCNRLIREVHKVLMNSVRGSDKTPGEFRNSQNWIGGAGSTLKNARYIPPNTLDMAECMSDFEKYLNSDDEEDDLIKAALLHYQFETIHPFLDGNGRVGRLLITLILIKAGLLSSPVLYLSCYLKSNRIEYYDRMSEIRKSGNYEQWVIFFLRGVAETALDAADTIDALNKLHNENAEKLAGVPKRSEDNVMKLFEYIERNPIIETVKTAAALGLSRNGTANYISLFCEKGILKQTAKSGKSLIYSYEDYLEILRKDTF
ncbi:MAG: Fic family protein [Clostridia bacterium]|nr:Fic family protein [Clostridia bacterium]MBR4450353.1 Fic family protein [Clostridia bacterium]